MTANTLAMIRDRVSSVAIGAGFSLSPEPLSFDRVPTLALDACCRIEGESGTQVGGMNYTSDQTDRVILWVARKTAGDPDATYRDLLVDASSLVSAIGALRAAMTFAKSS